MLNATRMKYTYYAAADSFSKSARAHEAENNGRYPRARAAKELGVSVKAFDSGCDAANYHTSEWHHVGAYATPVDYYDTNELKNNPAFWRGCGSSYKRAAKRAEFEEIARAVENSERQKILSEFRARMRQNLTPLPRPTHDSKKNWRHYCERQGCTVYQLPKPGDFEQLCIASQISANMAWKNSINLYTRLCERVERETWSAIARADLAELKARSIGERTSIKGRRVWTLPGGSEFNQSGHEGWIFCHGLAGLKSARDQGFGWGAGHSLYKVSDVLTKIQAI